MSKIRPGSRSVVLIVDVQVSVMANAWNASNVIGNIVRLVERAREQGVPVIWIQHEADDLPRGSPAWQLVPELVTAAGEQRIDKRFPSAFEETGLEDCLAEQGVAHIVLAGAQTNWCIRATAYAALERGYDLTLVKDAHTTETIELGEGGRLEASGMVMDLNIAMKWLSYPGRRNGTAMTEELDFSPAGSSL